jgi:GTPase SAR1 family protein
VGNKCDLPNRIVSTKDQEEYAKLMNMPFFEVSAKENINIEEVFLELIKLMHTCKEKFIKEPAIKLDKPKKDKDPEKQCC